MKTTERHTQVMILILKKKNENEELLHYDLKSNNQTETVTLGFHIPVDPQKKLSYKTTDSLHHQPIRKPKPFNQYFRIQ